MCTTSLRQNGLVVAASVYACTHGEVKILKGGQCVVKMEFRTRVEEGGELREFKRVV